MDPYRQTDNLRQRLQIQTREAQEQLFASEKQSALLGIEDAAKRGLESHEIYISNQTIRSRVLAYLKEQGLTVEVFTKQTVAGYSVVTELWLRIIWGYSSAL